MPSAYHVPAEAAHESDQPLYASTGLTGRGIIGNRSKPGASGAFAPSVWMRDKAAYGKGAEAARHLGSMHTRTKAATSSNAPSTD